MAPLGATALTFPSRAPSRIMSGPTPRAQDRGCRDSVMTIQEYLDPAGCPPSRPSLSDMGAATRSLHTSVDAAIKASGIPYLHPDGESIQLDLLGARHMTAWQEAK